MEYLCVSLCMCDVSVCVLYDTVLYRLKELLSLSEVKWREGGWKKKEKWVKKIGGAGLMTLSVCAYVFLEGKCGLL